MKNNFSRSDSAASRIIISMGMERIDKSENSMWRSDILGKAIPDPEFNPYTNDSQIFLKNLCLDLH